MGSFTNGVLVGIGLSLLLAPKPGKETRSLLAERFRSLRGLPSEQEDLKPSVQETPFAAPARTTVPGGAYLPPTNTSSVQSNLSNGVPSPGVGIPQTGLGDPGPTQQFRRVRPDQDPNRT